MKKCFLAFVLYAVSFSLAGPVSYYGELKVRSGTPFLEGSKTGEIVQVRGVSFGWSTTGWESERFYRTDAVDYMVKDWKAEVVRAAYGATSRAFSNSDAAENRERIETIVEAAIANDVYVIIDWHSHKAHLEVGNATDFFDYMAEKYGSYDNVIFEIYNEPVCSDGANSCNTGRTTWAEIKAYAEQIIPVIRKHSDNLILVGTPNWSQSIQNVVSSVIDDSNVGYVVHFYSDTHDVSSTSWTNNLDSAIRNNVPIFVTEYGTTNSDGGQSNNGTYNSHNATRSDAWHAFMDNNKISSAAWNINDKYEGSAFFGTVSRGFDFEAESWGDTEKMTESGKYIFRKLNEYYSNGLVWYIAAASVMNSVNLQAFYETDAVVYSLSGKKIGALANANLKNGVYILVSKQNGAVQRKIFKIVK